jgi:hypothetical protein
MIGGIHQPEEKPAVVDRRYSTRRERVILACAPKIQV